MPFLTKKEPAAMVKAKEEAPSNIRFSFKDTLGDGRVVVVEDPPKKFTMGICSTKWTSKEEERFTIKKPWSYMIFVFSDPHGSEPYLRHAILFFASRKARSLNDKCLCYAPVPNLTYTQFWSMDPGICMGDVRVYESGSCESRANALHSAFWNSKFTDELPSSRGTVPRWAGAKKGHMERLKIWERRTQLDLAMTWIKADEKRSSIRRASGWIQNT